MIVVIGHGPSPVGMGWGPRIDAAATVIRMVDCDWQGAADYGTRYDIGVLTSPMGRINGLLATNRRRPAAWWLYDHHRKLSAVADLAMVAGLPCRRMPPDRLAQAVAEMEADGAANGRGYRLDLTRGTAAVVTARADSPAEAIVLVGFDDVYRGHMAADSYAPGFLRQMGGAMPSWPAGATKTRAHDYAGESRLMRRLHGVRFGFGEEP